MKLKYVITLCFLIGIIFFISFIALSEKKIYFDLYGNEVVEVNVGEEYKEDGYKALYCNKYIKFFCKDITKYVNISKKNITDYKYYLNYDVNYKKNSNSKYREILLLDKESPKIILGEDINSCNSTLNSYQAIDNVDGDITDKVEITKKDNKIYYSVVDSSGNKKTVFREEKYVDKELPILKLKDNKTIYLFVGNEYKEKGYTAIDNCDGDITNRVIIDNNIDINNPGNYEVNYTVSDSSNNKTSIKREVIVYKDTSVIPKNGKIVYLTFDDGPGSYTESILNVLDKYNVKATFFVTNQFSSYKYLIKEEYEKGHTVAIHTYSHNYKNIYSSEENYINDLNSINQIIYEQTGHYSNLFRFPGGSSNTISKFNKGIMTRLDQKLTEMGYYYFDWNVDSGDTSTKDPDIIAKNVINGIMNNEESIVLMHDIKQANIQSVEKIISYGLENGYTFLPLDENSYVYHHQINN